RLASLSSNVDPRAGMISPRVTNENADATRAIQLATNSRRGFMRTVSKMKGAPSQGEIGFVSWAELLLDNRAAWVLPEGSRALPHPVLLMGRVVSRSAGCSGATAVSRWLRYTWAAPTTLVGLIAGALTLGTGGRVQRRQGALEFHGGFASWLAKQGG